MCRSRCSSLLSGERHGCCCVRNRLIAWLVSCFATAVRPSDTNALANSFVKRIDGFVQLTRPLFALRPEKYFFRSASNAAIVARMKKQSPGALFAAKVAARIREFRTLREISEEALVKAANLTPAEVELLNAESENMTRNMLERIAAVFNVHPAVLCMDPNEHALAKLLESQRDLPKDKFQKLAGELISKGFHRSSGAA